MGGPLRFDVQVAPTGVTLRLAAPVAVGPARITELALDLGRVPAPIDLSRGAAALRHRRARVRGLHVELSPAALIAHAEERGLSLEATLLPRTSRVRLGGRDAPAATVVFPVAVGADLLLVPLADDDEGAPPRLGDVEALRSLFARVGFRAEGRSAAVRAPEPIRRLLAEAFATRGHRVPRLGPLAAAAWVGPRSLHYGAGEALGAHARPPELAGYITDIASLIDRSADGETGALLRDAARRLAAHDAHEDPDARGADGERPAGPRGA